MRKVRTGNIFILSFTVLLILADGRAFGYSGGDGTAGNPYKIASKTELLAMAADTGNYDKCFILTADIDMGGQVFTTAIIAPGDSVGNSFGGTFDGKGHKITNFIINGGSIWDLGLFGHIKTGGSVKNLGLENFTINGSNCVSVGGLAVSNDGSISNCYSTGSVNCSTEEGSIVGGLVGMNGGSISNCYSTGQVSSRNAWVGGLVGWNFGNISNCYSTGSVIDMGTIPCFGPGYDVHPYTVGGLVGWNDGTLTACYATGGVNGSPLLYGVGGLVGDNGGGIGNGIACSISNCYSTGAVTGGFYIGGLVGWNDGSCDINSSFWDTQTSGQATSEGGTGKMTAEMKLLSTFTSAGWDFDTIWDIDENVTYPSLRVSGGEKTLPEKAAELAKQVIGAPYLGDGETWGGKGYDYDLRQFVEPDGIKATGYKYWNNKPCVKKATKQCYSCAGGNCEQGTDGAIGLDCSGLFYWSYNRAYFQSRQPGALRPFAYEGVSGQWSNYSIKAPVNESDLHAGDMLFMDGGGHVMMYTGPFTYDGKTYNVVHASYYRRHIVPATYDFAMKKVITENCDDISIAGYGRWREQTVTTISARCPVDLVVTDPDGFTVSKDIPEVPGLLYFSVYDIDGNGRPEEMVTIPKRKVGTYLISVIPEPNVLPTDTYSLETTIDGQTIVLAKDVQIQNVPPQPYEVRSRLNLADFDDNGHVDAVDLNTFVLHWLVEDCNNPGWCEGTDLSYSGRVDFTDFALFAQNWLWEKIPADFDMNDNVDSVDYAVFANRWMYHDCVEPSWCAGADFDHSGTVDMLDLATFAGYWLEER